MTEGPHPPPINTGIASGLDYTGVPTANLIDPPRIISRRMHVLHYAPPNFRLSRHPSLRCKVYETLPSSLTVRSVAGSGVAQSLAGNAAHSHSRAPSQGYRAKFSYRASLRVNDLVDLTPLIVPPLGMGKDPEPIRRRCSFPPVCDLGSHACAAAIVGFMR